MFTKKQQKEYNARVLKKHLEDLKLLGYIPNDLKPLQKIEAEAHKLAEDDCNGVAECSPEHQAVVLHEVRKLFSKTLPGLIFNGDPRGYTIKIDDDVVRKENIEIYRDMGGYGILAPEFTDWN